MNYRKLRLLFVFLTLTINLYSMGGEFEVIFKTATSLRYTFIMSTNEYTWKNSESGVVLWQNYSFQTQTNKSTLRFDSPDNVDVGEFIMPWGLMNIQIVVTDNGGFAVGSGSVTIDFRDQRWATGYGSSIDTRIIIDNTSENYLMYLSKNQVIDIDDVILNGQTINIWDFWLQGSPLTTNFKVPITLFNKIENSNTSFGYLNANGHQVVSGDEELFKYNTTQTITQGTIDLITDVRNYSFKWNKTSNITVNQNLYLTNINFTTDRTVDTREITRVFRPVYQLIIKNISTESGNTNSFGDVLFKDPTTDNLFHSYSAAGNGFVKDEAFGELNERIGDLFNQKYSLKAISPISYNGRNYYWQSGDFNPTTQTDLIITTQTNKESYYKGTQLSNQTNAYSNTSQRRFIQTFNPNLNLKTLHIVYESMGHVWYETSTNNGVTWNIMNNGKPLDTGGGRTPSMDYHYQNGSNNQMNEIIIVWQENFNGWACIKIATFYQDGSSAYAPFVKLYDGFVLGPDQIEFAKPFSENSNPVVGWTDQDVESQALILWQGKYDDIFGKIEGLVYKIGRISGAGATWDINIPTHLSTQTFSTNINSVNPTITNYKESYYGYNWHIAWEQIINSSTSQIKYSRLDWNILNNQLTIGSIEEASLNSGYSKNYNPVIIVRKVGTSQEYIFVTWLGNRTSPTTETRVLLKYKLGSNWSVTGVYGTTPVQNFSINKGTEMTNNQEPLAMCWSEQSTYPFTTKLMKSPGTGTILVLSNLTGKDMQINNGTNFSSMFANSFSSSSLPYSFNLSQNFGSINKENSMQIFNGREGIVGKNDAQFFFALGDISVDGQNIKFVSIPDTISVGSLSLLNNYFESEPFIVSSTSNLTYGVQYGITDSLLCSNVLNTNENISFKVELIDALTNQVLGVYDEVTYTDQNVFQYNNIGYRVNLSGIGERAVKFRLLTSTNAEFGYGLANRIADESILAKGSYQSINYQGNLAVTDYALEQNYPNPFNPVTTIKFQIPADGFVTLKVYDILGNEVTTLINEEKVKGRYELNFNASNLASGVYIYKIQAGTFMSSKKMLLLK